MKKYILVLISLPILLLPTFRGNAQSEGGYDLNQIINLAQQKSLAAQAATNRKKNRYWQYRVFKSNYNPQLQLRGNLPNYSNLIRTIPTQDGDVFANQNQLSTSARLDLSQAISLTGGRVFVGSQLRRNDFFGDLGNSTQFATDPLLIGFEQPIFQFNNLKWDKEIEPLRYEESVKAYNEDLETISLQATDLYFSLLLAQVNYKIASLNKANNDTIFQIAQGRYQLGKIAENELLQLELNVVTAEQELAGAKLDMETAALNLNTFVGNTNNEKITLSTPEDIPEFLIDETIALEQAQNNRQAFVNFERRRLEAEREVARAKGDNGLQLNLFGSFGLTQQSDRFSNSYQDPQQQQQISLGFQIPVMDWGRQKARMQTSLANRELIKNTVAQDEVNFRQEIIVLVRQFSIFKQRVESTKRAEDVAQRSYDIANKRYLVGKISITDLNITLQQKDRSKRDYLAALREYWIAYYRLRLLTLYDFESQEVIQYESSDK